jgi:hypothetical protein
VAAEPNDELEFLTENDVAVEVPTIALSDEPPTPIEAEWISEVERVCRSSMSLRADLESTLESAVSKGDLSLGDLEHIRELVSSLIQNHEALVDSFPDGARSSFQVAVDEVAVELAMVSEIVDGLTTTNWEDEGVKVSSELRLSESKIELAWTRLGTQACDRQ